MPRNGSGTYQLPAGNPVVTGSTISSSGWANPTLSDIAAALSASIAVDGQTTPTANLPMGNFRHLQVANGQNTNEYATVGQIQTAGFQLLGGNPGTINTTQTITTTQGITSGATVTAKGLVLNEPASSTATLTINAAGDTNGAGLHMLGNGSTTPSKTIRVLSGTFQVVNDSYSAAILSIDDPGNLTALGNISALSDERLKKGWGNLPSDFIERLSTVRSGTYTRIDTTVRQVGVGAQSLRTLLPEAVTPSDDGYLSVAYGQAALAACVELAKEVVRLRALLEPVK